MPEGPLPPQRGQRVVLGSESPAGDLAAHVADVLRALGHEVVVAASRPTRPAALGVASAVAAGDVGQGVIVAPIGHGAAILANRTAGIRAVWCEQPHAARLAREQVDANVLVLGSSVVAPAMATVIVETWMATRSKSGDTGRGIALADGAALGGLGVAVEPDRGPFRIRQARPDDADELVAIVTASAPDLRASAEEELVPVVRGDQRGGFVVAVDEQDAALGTIGWIPDIWGVSDILWLVWLYLRPERRRTGVADALMTSIMEDCRAEGARKVYLDVGNADTHGPAIRFHERHGFRQEGHLVDFWHDGEDMFVFGRRL